MVSNTRWTYDELKEFIASVPEITSLREYKDFARTNNANSENRKIPVSPDLYFKKTDEWVSSADFIGKNKKKTSTIKEEKDDVQDTKVVEKTSVKTKSAGTRVSNIDWTYDELKQYLAKLKIPSLKEYKDFARTNNANSENRKIPVSPDLYFKKRGAWKSYSDLLSIDASNGASSLEKVEDATDAEIVNTFVAKRQKTKPKEKPSTVDLVTKKIETTKHLQETIISASKDEDMIDITSKLDLTDPLNTVDKNKVKKVLYTFGPRKLVNYSYITNNNGVRGNSINIGISNSDGVLKLVIHNESKIPESKVIHIADFVLKAVLLEYNGEVVRIYSFGKLPNDIKLKYKELLFNLVDYSVYYKNHN